MLVRSFAVALAAECSARFYRFGGEKCKVDTKVA